MSEEGARSAAIGSSSASSGSSSASSGSSPAIAAASFGEYTLLEPIGAGRTGTVYRVERHGRTLALKLLARGGEILPACLERFLRANPARVRHSNIMTLEEFGCREGRDFVAMQFLRGDSLARLLDEIREGRSARPSFSPVAVGPHRELHPAYLCRAVELVAEVAEGVERAHSAGLTHLCLSPRDLIFSTTGRLVVTDFGIRAPPSTDADVYRLAYQSPEQLVSTDVDGDARADVYALGAILYELATFAPPYHGRTAAELRAAVLTGSAPKVRKVRDEVPSSLEDIILEAMALNPDARYSSAGSLADDLRRYLQGRTPRAKQLLAVHAAVAEPQTASARPARRALRVAAAAVLTVLLALTVEGGRRLRSLGERESIRETALGFEADGEHGRALSEAERLVSLDPSDRSARTFLSSIARTAANAHLVSATLALEAADFRSASAQLADARRLLPGEARLADLEARLAKEAVRDPLDRMLDDPLPSTRLAAIDLLVRSVRSGARSADSVAIAVRAILDEDAAVQTAAFRALAVAPSSAALLDVLGINRATEAEPVRLDGRVFLELYRTLLAVRDQPALDLLCTWSLEDFEGLDAVEAPADVRLAPAVAVALDRTTPRQFSATWLEAAPGLDARALLAASTRLSARDELIPKLASALGSLAEPEAIRALVRLGTGRCIEAGDAVLTALARRGAAAALVDLARNSSLPVAYRVSALDRIDGTVPLPVRHGIEQLVIMNPDADVRAAAFTVLERLGDEQGFSASTILLAAVDETPLRTRALDWIERLPGNERATTAFALFAHTNREVRRRAEGILAQDDDLAHGAVVLVGLFSSDPRVRSSSAATLAARRDRELLGSFTRQAIQNIGNWARKRLEPFLELRSHWRAPEGEPILDALRRVAEALGAE